MYSKEELLSKEMSELEDIAKTLGAEYDGDNIEELVYSILDKQAIDEGTKNPLGQKKKRTRIVKKDTDRVYSVKGKDGENFDVKNNKVTPSEQPSLFKEVEETTAETEAEEPAKPKKRGRKSKKEKEAEAAALAEAERLAKEAEEQQKEENKDESAPEQVTAEPDDNIQAEPQEVVDEQAEAEPINEMSVPEAGFLPEANDMEENQDAPDSGLLAQLQAKINARNEGSNDRPDPIREGYWEGDPGDGTDFITVVDLPIEDQGALPNYDIFDNPTNGMPNAGYQQPEPVQPAQPAYDFSDLITADGVLEIMPDGYGFLRSSDYNYLSSPDDVYVSTQQVKKYGLKTGDVVQSRVRPPREGEKYFPLTSIDMINGRVPDEIRDRVPFEHLTPLFPDEKFNLCGNPATTNLSTRIVDLFSPIGKGQRALIVAQPKTGKTILMKNIANAIAANHPEAYLMMLLIDERP